MKKIQFLKPYGNNCPGDAIGTLDSAADSLVAQGFAVFIDDSARLLKYQPGAPVQTECFTPEDEENGVAPKGAIPAPTYQVVLNNDEVETKIIKAK